MDSGNSSDTSQSTIIANSSNSSDTSQSTIIANSSNSNDTSPSTIIANSSNSSDTSQSTTIANSSNSSDTSPSTIVTNSSNSSNTNRSTIIVNSSNSSGMVLITHAAGNFLERASLLSVYHNNNANRPLLGELNINGYYQIKKLVQKTFHNCNISQIHHVYAPQMYGMYLLRKEEMELDVGQSVQERMLFHVTTKSRAIESLESGLDWRRTKRNKFGCGVSFSDNADYANYYADNHHTEDTRVIILCSVLVKDTYVIPIQDNGSILVVPPNSADTTKSFNDHVYVKFNDNEFYPKYFVYYEQRPEHRKESKFYRANSRRAWNRYEPYRRNLH